ncbi:anaerobic ribonucleoside-triphosphate reductase activating protein [Actinoplanes lutulentus]|uniref:Anaerobic ribonucleoside-triphosphate reductase activating protein n=1 Tax=Actinoplanes lutulentus TaxID=1287878 RepID=A0A327Z1Q3_9ACTN|nr:4Fe-4S single cluster domain-containing protein [Actinoplanes lutulentus]MBB2943306.1 anaerobic ribonucleoside-triphosphate reductase activating protein [Actinoplanes lutulentus]RAK28365.1 anaerobic ribonucleoside-triphosphate reductase activating protein [Actinoplanes lutulentus]
MSATVVIGRVLASTDAEGPGCRTAIWVQGCSIRCSGCFNPHFWSLSGGATTTVRELLGIVKKAGTEGITLLGGEPFDQAEPLSEFAAGVRAAGGSVMTFTGYTLAHLRAAGDDSIPGAAALLAATDLLLDGPFLRHQIDRSRPWLGSTNQGVHFLTDRYAYLRNQLASERDRIEVRIGPQGSVEINGWTDIEALDTLLAGVVERVTPGR